MEINNKSFIKKVGSFFGVLLIGALGSGFWEICLKDFVYYVGGLFVISVNHFSNGYIDSLYEHIGRVRAFNQLPIVLLLLSGIAFPLFQVYLRWKNAIFNRPVAEKELNNVPVKPSKKYRGRIGLFLFLLSIPISIMYMDLFIKLMTHIKVNNYMETTTEIIRPYMNETDYYRLRSEYRLVNSRGDFETLVSKIDSCGKVNNLQLPESKFYGVEVK